MDIDRKIIDAYEKERLTPKERERRVGELLHERWQILNNSFEWTPENIKAIEAANELLIEECLGAAKHLADVVEKMELTKPADEIDCSDYEAFVKVESFKSDDKMYDYSTHIEDILVSRFNRNYHRNGVRNLFYMSPDFGHGVTGLEKGNVLWLDNTKETDNWNEHLAPDATKDMHLCYAFHWLLVNCEFAPQDILNIKTLGHVIKIHG